MRTIRDAVAWLLSAAALLTVGFLAWVYLGAQIGAAVQSDPAASERLYAAMVIYAWVVLAKGLLPALLLTFALWPVIDRIGRFSRRRFGIALGLALAAALASAAITGLLLPLNLPGLPPVRSTGAGGSFGTGVQMAAAVAVAAWIPRAVPASSRRRALLLVAGLAVALVTAGASATWWMPRRVQPADRPMSPVAAVPRAPAPPSQTADAPVAEPEAPMAPTLPPPLQSPPAPPEQPSSEEIARRHALAERIRALIEKAPTASDTAELGGLLAEGDAQPIYQDGELRGIGLENVRPDGFYAWLGLRDGDLVQSINGTPLDASGALFQQLIASPQIELQVERSDGSQQQISVTRQQIFEGLQRLE